MTSLENKINKHAKLPDHFSTEVEDVSIDRLQREDSEEFIAKIQDSAKHLAAGGLYHHWRYRTSESVMNALNDPNINIFAIRHNDELIGDIHVVTDERNSRRAEVSEWISENNTGRGLGTIALRAIMPEVDHQGIELTSKIEIGNNTSRAIFENQGFTKIKTERSDTPAIKDKNVFVRTPAK